MNKILVEVSVGELLDKISILEIKKEKINKLETETTAELSKDEIEIIVEEPEKDYTLLTDEELISELKAIIENKPVQEIKSIVEIIKTEFNSKFNDELRLYFKSPPILILLFDVPLFTLSRLFEKNGIKEMLFPCFGGGVSHMRAPA